METIKFEDFQKLDLRVAEILEVILHPNADKLLVLKVRVGEVEKQIVAGIKAHYAPENLIGRKIVIVNNLEPVKLRGEESQGMLLAASNPEEGLSLIGPDRSLASGSQVK